MSNEKWFRPHPMDGFPLELFPCSGRLYDRVYYWRYGKQCVRSVGNMNKTRVLLDPCFTGTRASNREFAAAARVSKVIRDGIGPGAFALGGQYLHLRLGSLIREGFRALPGVMGSKPLDMATALQDLRGFDFGSHRGSISLSDLGRQWLSYDSGFNPGLLWQFEGHAVPGLADLPKSVRYLRFSVFAVAVADMQKDAKGRRYLHSRPDAHGLKAVKQSVVLSLPELANWRWEVRIDSFFRGVNLDGCGVVVSCGVEFFDQHPQLVTVDPAAPCAILPKGWDDRSVPVGKHGRKRALSAYRKKEGRFFRVLEVVYAGCMVRRNQRGVQRESERERGVHREPGVQREWERERGEKKWVPGIGGSVIREIGISQVTIGCPPWRILNTEIRISALLALRAFSTEISVSVRAG